MWLADSTFRRLAIKDAPFLSAPATAAFLVLPPHTVAFVTCHIRQMEQASDPGKQSELQLTFKDSIPGASKRRTVVKSSGSNVNLMRAECHSCFEYLYGHLESSQRDSVDGMRTLLFLSLCSGKGHSSYCASLELNKSVDRAVGLGTHSSIQEASHDALWKALVRLTWDPCRCMMLSA